MVTRLKVSDAQRGTKVSAFFSHLNRRGGVVVHSDSNKWTIF